MVITVKIYQVFSLFILIFLTGCSGPSMPANIRQYSEKGYIFYGCCDYGYFNNSNYCMGGPDHLGCYTPDCSLSLWR